MANWKKSNRYCSVPNCSTRAAKDISFHYFPRDLTLKKEWCRVLRIGKSVTKYMNVCSLHFKTTDYFLPGFHTSKRFLKKGSVPSLNLPKSPLEKVLSSPEKQSHERTDRAPQRPQYIKVEASTTAFENVDAVYSDTEAEEEMMFALQDPLQIYSEIKGIQVKMGDQSILRNISALCTEDVLLSIIRKIKNDEAAEIIQYTTPSGDSTRTGDSFLSTMVRLKVTGRTADGNEFSVSLILKGLPTNIARRKTFRCTEFFHNETAFYTQVVPKLMEFQEKRKPKKCFDCLPRCYHAFADGENDFIILEDLGEKGFVTPNRGEGLDADHIFHVLEALGRFHALSLAMKDQDPENFKKAVECLKETYYAPRYKPWYLEQLKKLITVMTDALHKEYPNSLYEKKLQTIVDDPSKAYDQICELVVPEEPYAAVGHGDCWTPNFLFRYHGDNSSPEDVSIIDFQLARYGSPLLDVSFFIYSATTEELRQAHFKNMLRMYYNALSDFLVELGSDPKTVFPKDAFDKEVKRRFFYGMLFSFESVPFSVMEDDEVPNIDIIEGDEAVPLESVWHVAPLKSQKGRLRLAGTIKHAVDNGYF